MRRVLGNYLGFLVFLLLFPIKLFADLAAYLFGFQIPSPTELVIPLIAIGILLFPLRIPRGRPVPLLFLAWFFLAFVVVVSLNFMFRHVVGTEEVLINAMLMSVLLYFSMAWTGLYYWHSENLVARVLFLAVIVSSAITLYTQFYVKDVWSTLNESGAYLRIADLFAFISLLVLMRSRSAVMSVVLILVGVVTLLYIGSRSSLLFYVAAISVFGVYRLFVTGVSLRRGILVAGVVVAMILPIASNSDLVEMVSGEFSASRIGYTIEVSGGGADARGDFLRAGMGRILSDPFTGNIYTRLNSDPSGGSYIHGFLFLLDDYGLFVFLPFLLLVGWAVSTVLRGQAAVPLLLPLLFCLMSMGAARAYAFPYVFYLIGILIGAPTLFRKRTDCSSIKSEDGDKRRGSP